MLIDGRDSHVSDGDPWKRSSLSNYLVRGRGRCRQSLAGHIAGWLDLKDGGAYSLMTCLGRPRGTEMTVAQSSCWCG